MYRKNEIWLHQSTKEQFQELFERASVLNNIASHIAEARYDFIQEQATNEISVEKKEIIDIELRPSHIQEEELYFELPINVEEECHQMLDMIDSIREHIIKINGIDELDKLTDTLLNNSPTSNNKIKFTLW